MAERRADCRNLEAPAGVVISGGVRRWRRFARVVPAAALAAVALFWFYARAGGGSAAVALPAPAVDMPRAAAAEPGRQTVVLAGGCFWGVEAVFRHVKGVIEATSGYAGGSAATAQYELVSEGHTGHAESVRVTFECSRRCRSASCCRSSSRSRTIRRR